MHINWISFKFCHDIHTLLSMINVILQEDKGQTLSQLVDQGSVSAVMEFFEKYEVWLICRFRAYMYYSLVLEVVV